MCSIKKEEIRRENPKKIVKPIDIEGNVKFDQDVQDSVNSWNEIIKKIML